MMLWIYDFNPWLICSLIVLVFVLVSTVGLLIMRPVINRNFRITDETNEPINGIFSGTGMLLGILLGLVAVAVWENYDAVDDVVVKEASEVAALYRDVSTLKDPVKSELEKDLKDYLNYVIDVAWPGHKKGETPTGGTLVLSNFLGKLNTYKADTPEQLVFLGEVFSAYNKLIEARRARLAMVDSGLPGVFWVVIMVGSFFSILVVFFFHISDIKTHLVLTGIYSAFLGFMIFMVAMVDHPFRGEMGIQPDAYQSVLTGLKDLEAIQIPVLKNGK